MRDIIDSTRDFESWLHNHIQVNESDLEVKHLRMAADPFQFLRATFYRWVEIWPVVCPELASLDTVLAVGDLHIQNFGTWRDSQGRLVWGINDFDEAGNSSFANDLVRLAVSARIAGRVQKLLDITPDEAVEAIYDGYRRGAFDGGRPYVLERTHSWLTSLTKASLKEPRQFWITWMERKTQPLAEKAVPESARLAFAESLPKGVVPEYYVRNEKMGPKGLGSLGRQRIFAFAQWLGGPIAREAKVWAPASYTWAHDHPADQSLMAAIDGKGVRSSDPFFTVQNGWVMHAVAADRAGVGLEAISRDDSKSKRAETQIKILTAMGYETANIHLGVSAKGELAGSLAALDLKSLTKGVAQMEAAVISDFEQWQASRKKKADVRPAVAA